MAGSSGSDGLGTGALALINIAVGVVFLFLGIFSARTGIAVSICVCIGVAFIIAALYDFLHLGDRGERKFRVRQERRQERQPMAIEHRSEHDQLDMCDMPKRMFSPLPSPPPDSP